MFKKTMLLACLSIATVYQPVKADTADTFRMIADGAQAAKDIAATIHLVKDLKAEDVELFFDNANTITWDILLPLIIAFISAKKCAGQSWQRSHGTAQTTYAATKGLCAAVVGGGAAYLAGSIPKQMLKNIFSNIAQSKKSLENSMQ